MLQKNFHSYTQVAIYWQSFYILSLICKICKIHFLRSQRHLKHHNRKFWRDFEMKKIVWLDLNRNLFDNSCLREKLLLVLGLTLWNDEQIWNILNRKQRNSSSWRPSIPTKTRMTSKTSNFETFLSEKCCCCVETQFKSILSACQMLR